MRAERLLDVVELLPERGVTALGRVAALEVPHVQEADGLTTSGGELLRLDGAVEVLGDDDADLLGVRVEADELEDFASLGHAVARATVQVAGDLDAVSDGALDGHDVLGQFVADVDIATVAVLATARQLGRVHLGGVGAVVGSATGGSNKGEGGHCGYGSHGLADTEEGAHGRKPPVSERFCAISAADSNIIP